MLCLYNRELDWLKMAVMLKQLATFKDKYDKESW